MKIHYEVNMSSVDDIYNHLSLISDSFPIPLTSRVNISDYSFKIRNFAKTYECWSEDLLIGLLAVYYNSIDDTSFITHMGILSGYQRYGIASKLIETLKLEYRNVKLEVHRDNIVAILFYKKMGFLVDSEFENEIIMIWRG